MCPVSVYRVLVCTGCVQYSGYTPVCILVFVFSGARAVEVAACSLAADSDTAEQWSQCSVRTVTTVACSAAVLQ